MFLVFLLCNISFLVEVFLEVFTHDHDESDCGDEVDDDGYDDDGDDDDDSYDDDDGDYDRHDASPQRANITHESYISQMSFISQFSRLQVLISP